MMTENSKPKILIVGPAWVGDMVMAQSLFIHLKQEHPEAHIDVLAPAWTKPLLDRMPEVSGAIEMPIGHKKLALLQRYEIGKQLQQRNYDMAFVLPNSFKSALIPFFAQIPVRRGWRGEQRFGILNQQQKLNKKRYPLMVQRFVALAYPWGEALPEIKPPKLQVDPQQLQQTIAKFELKTNKPIIALCPGAEFGPSKQWPSKYYAQVAQHFLDKDYAVWLFGSPNDGPTALEIQTACADKCENLVGKTSLAEAIDLLSMATTVICNDSGLMHIAAALDRPLTAVYGSTSPGFTPPLNTKVKILQAGVECSPCFQRVCPLQHNNCMQQLTPNMIIPAVEELLAV